MSGTKTSDQSPEETQHPDRVCQTRFGKPKDKLDMTSQANRKNKGGRPKSYEPSLVYQIVSEGLEAGTPATELNADFVKTKAIWILPRLIIDGVMKSQ